MKELNKTIIILLLFCLTSQLQAQGEYKLMFYNVENLFDIYNDSLKNDDEFTENGDKFWNNRKYYEKLNNIYKVITAIGEWNAPSIIGLCEIENRFVLDELISKTPLYKLNYEVVHYESPDKRGIDVALLYRPNHFEVIESKPVQVFLGSSNRPTRDILYVKGILAKSDTLHIFINHWPSRWGGQANSEPKRIQAAQVLRKSVDSLCAINPNASIIITGDFNDHPTDKSITETLNAKTSVDSIEANQLYNLSFYLEEKMGLWTYKFHEEKGILDQIIVSGALLNQTNKIYTTKDEAFVFTAPFLLEKDEQGFGEKPFRTYIGFKYNGGFSDHLPTYINLKIQR